MSFMYPLGLLGLIGVPILIIIYILRSKFLYKPAILIGYLYIYRHASALVALTRQVLKRIDQVADKYDYRDETKEYFENFKHGNNV